MVVVMGMTTTIKLDRSMTSGPFPDSGGWPPAWADRRWAAPPGGLARGFRYSRLAGSSRSARFPAVSFLVATPVGQRVADDLGEAERHRPASTSTPENPGDHVEIQVQVVGDLVVGARGPQQAVEA